MRGKGDLTRNKAAVERLVEAGEETMADIATRYSVTPQAVYQFCYKHKIKSSRRTVGKISGKQAEIKEMILAGMQYPEIANKFGVSAPTICRCIKKYYPELSTKPGRRPGHEYAARSKKRTEQASDHPWRSQKDPIQKPEAGQPWTRPFIKVKLQDMPCVGEFKPCGSQEEMIQKFLATAHVECPKRWPVKLDMTDFSGSGECFVPDSFNPSEV